MNSSTLMFIRSLDEKEQETEEFENMTDEKMEKIFPAIKGIKYGKLPDFDEDGNLLAIPDCDEKKQRVLLHFHDI